MTQPLPLRMTTTLIIARHGNTFEAGEPPRRVGGRTDLALTAKGLEQGRAIGHYLKKHNMIPDDVYSAPLKRTRQTAEEITRICGIKNPIQELDFLREIDYGPDEDLLESDVVERIGEAALRAWDQDALVPEGWAAEPDSLISAWRTFANEILAEDAGGITLAVTSNGIARFAPHITGDFEGFRAAHPLKLSTGAFGILRHEGAAWQVVDWNVRPH